MNAGPDHVHAGDLNGDGQLDLVSSSFGDNLLSVNLATGNGNFAAKTSQTTPITNPGDFVLGDYNGDGKLDVVVTGFAGGAGTQVMFYRGDGTGSFAAPLLFNVGTGPFTIAQGDFNQDGLADLAVGNVFSGDLTLLLGNGTSFPTATNFALGGLSPGDTSVADFNNDGFADVAVVLSGSDRVALLLGNGQGGLAGPTNLATGTFPINSSVADFNGDGRADLIVGNGNSQTFSLFLNNGGGLNPAVSLPAGDRPNAITTGDVNLDGIADLVNSRPGGLVQLRLGVGDGTFQAPSNLNIDTGNGNGDVEIADLNQDTVPDLAVAVTAPAQVLNILLQTP